MYKLIIGLILACLVLTPVVILSKSVDLTPKTTVSVVTPKVEPVKEHVVTTPKVTKPKVVVVHKPKPIVKSVVSTPRVKIPCFEIKMAVYHYGLEAVKDNAKGKGYSDEAIQGALTHCKIK